FDCRTAGQGGPVGSADLDVLEALVREARRPPLVALAPRDVVVGLELAADEPVTFGAGAAVLPQDLAVEDLDGRARGRAHADGGPTAEVLPHVVDEDPGRGLRARSGRALRHDAARLADLGAHDARRRGHHPSGGPARVVEAG